MPLYDPPSRKESETVRKSDQRSGPATTGGLLEDLRHIRVMVANCEAQIAAGRRRRLPGQTAFLSDGRVLCKERNRGDSRYPYGHDGLNFWVNASGYMHGNLGLFFMFLPSLEDQEPPIAFFAGSRTPGAQSFRPLSLLPTPFLAEDNSPGILRYTVIGHDAVFFVAQGDDLLTAVRVFVDQSRPETARIHFSSLVCNESGQPLEIFTSAYMNPFCRHQFAPTNEDRWFKQIQVADVPPAKRRGDANAECYPLAPFVVTTNEDISRFQSISNFATIRRVLRAQSYRSGAALPLEPRNGAALHDDRISNKRAIQFETQECTARLHYTGSPRRQLATASFLRHGRFERDPKLTVFNDTAVAGDLIRMTLPADVAIRADYVFTVPRGPKSLALERDCPIDCIAVDQAMKTVRDRQVRQGDFSMAVGESGSDAFDSKTFNAFLPFLKKQVAICAQLKGYMHPSPNSLIGFRDVFQAIEGHLFDHPRQARDKILEAMDYVLADGRCPRQYSLPVNGVVGRADLREFIDQGAWVISAIHTYLAVTGDATLLKALAQFHRLDPMDGAAIQPTGEQSTVLDHLLRIVDYLARHRDPETGLVLAMYGDWNDALDGLGMPSDPRALFGTGVSVMTSLQLYANCAELIDILTHFAPGEHEDEIERLRRLSEQLREGLLRYAVVSRNGERRVVHGWGDQRRYFVGSFCDSDHLARDGLTSNAFWILCGLLDVEPSMRDDLLAAFERLDSPLGMRTFAPGFAADAPGVGRITRLPEGAAENGAVYIHATAFAIDALFRVGRARQAWRQIEKILPFSAHHVDPSHSPFVMPNSYVDNAELNLTGQSMNDWQTGCSNVLMKTLIRRVAGFDPRMDVLRVAPAAWLPFESLEFTGRYQGRRVRITIHHAKVDQLTFHVNGRVAADVGCDEHSTQRYASIAPSALKTDGVNEIAVILPKNG